MDDRRALTVCFLILLTTYSTRLVAQGRISNLADEKSRIISKIKFFHYGYKAHSPEKLVDQIDLQDTYLLPSRMPIAHGRDAIIAMHQEIMMDGADVLDFQTDTIDMYGTNAVTLHHYEEDRADSSVFQMGRTIMIWKKDSETGKWRRAFGLWSRFAISGN